MDSGQVDVAKREIKADRQPDRPSNSRVIRIVNILTRNNNLDEVRFILKINHPANPRSSVSTVNTDDPLRNPRGIHGRS